MSEEQPSLQIDTDWKRQAQEEKRKLAEKEQQDRAKPPAAPGSANELAAAATLVGGAPSADAARRGGRELPPATFETLVNQLLTQTLVYLGELSQRGMEPTVNLDLARHQLDVLTMLEQKTLNNLNETEKRSIDSALYEARMRFVSVATQYL